jgi:hypothetical protein
MKLYKYRSLVNLEYILDIILNQRLHCSTYLELNDPFEGIFETTILPYYYHLLTMGIGSYGMMGLSYSIPSPLGAIVQLQGKTYKNKVEDLDSSANDKIRICSLSSDLNDVRLWSYYADGHKGIVFEIDFSGLETRNSNKIICPVEYSEKLPRSSTTTNLRPNEVLSHKTNHWAFESEYRIIDESKYLEEGKYFDIKGRIKAIYLGSRISDHHRKLLNKIVPSGIPIYTTNINKEKIIVESGACIPERKTSP